MHDRKRILIGIFCIIGIIALRFSGVHTYINLSYIQKNLHLLHEFVHLHYMSAPFIFLSIYIIVIACSIPISPLLNMLAGAVFPWPAALLYCVTGATMGALCSFFLVRYAFGKPFQVYYAKQLATFNQEIEKRGASYLLCLQLLPVTPFAAVIIVSGLSRVSWITFLWTTAIGIAPGTYIYVMAGKSLSIMRTMQDIFSVPVIIGLCILAIISLVPLIITRFKKV